MSQGSGACQCALPSLVLSVAMAGASCAYAGAQFTIDRSAELLSANNLISVFGVYKDGQMNFEYWGELGPRMASVFGHDTCELLFDERLHSEESDVFSRIDEDTKQNGVSSDLLNQFAARAKGTHIVAIQISAHSPTHQPSNMNTGSVGARPLRSGRSGGRRGRSVLPAKSVDDSEFDAYVSLLSVKAHQIVLNFAMQYTGPTVDDAIKKFAARLSVEIPRSTCVGWKWGEPPTTAVIESTSKSYVPAR